MGDLWSRGDLALCVSDAGIKSPPPAGHSMPRVGGVYEVEGVLIHPFTGEVGLVLVGHHSTNQAGPARHSRYYRKIQPHKPDQEDVETIRLIKSPGKQRVSA